MEMGRDEIAQHVDLSALPEGTQVRAYTLVHEGESQPHDMDTGESLALRWGKAVVRRVAALARAGTQFVRSHTDRTVMGEVLGTFTKEVAGVLRAIVIGAFRPGAADGMDVCSVEADGVERDAHGTVLDVSSVDAVALGSSRHDQPGFPGAVLMGSPIQCFVEPGSGRGDGGKKPVTVKEILEYLEVNPGLLPGQLFSDAQIEAHPTVAVKLRDHESTNGTLTRTISRRDAKDAMKAKVAGWTPDAQFHAETAFDGWAEPSGDPAKLDEWLKGTGERYKGRSGKDVKAPAPAEGDPPVDPNAGYHQDPPPLANQPPQPNQPPAGGGADVVQTAMQTLGIIKKEAA